MYIRKTKTTINGKRYENYLLVESIQTEKGPRQKTICSLGNLKARSKEEWLELVRKVENTLTGQLEIFQESQDKEVAYIVSKANEFNNRKKILEESIASGIEVYQFQR